MSEFEKVLRTLDARSGKTPSTFVFNADYNKNILLSGDSEYQIKMITDSTLNYKNSTIILAYQDKSLPYINAFNNNPRSIFIGERSHITYQPFAGHDAKRIKDMLISIAGNPSATFKLLLGVIADLLVINPFLIEEASEDYVSLDFFDCILDRSVQSRKISEETKSRMQNKLRNCTASFADFDALIADLPSCITKSANARFRRIQTLQSFISDNKIIVFLFQGDYNNSSDNKLLNLLSLDLYDVIYNSAVPIRFVVDDFKYQYLRPFERFFDYPTLFSVLNISSSADFVHNKMYEQFVKSKFDAYGIFRHHNSDSCEFWSNAIGMSEVADNTYGNSLSKGINIPRGLFNGAIINRQNSDTVSIHYTDKNIVKPYLIKNLNSREYLYFEKATSILRRLSL